MMDSSAKKKPDDFMGTWVRILHYIKKYRYMLILTAALSAVASVLSLLGPYFISQMTDLIEKGIDGTMDYGRVENLAFTLFAIYLVSGLISFFENYMMATVSQRSAQLFRRDVSRKMNRIPLRYFDQSSKGDVMSRVTNDIDTLGTSMNQCIGSVVTSITTLCGATVLMLFMNIPLTALTVAIASIGFVVIKKVAKRTQKYFKAQQKNLGAMNGLVEEQYSGHVTVTVYAGQKEAAERFGRINDDLGKSAFRSQFLGGISSYINGLISNVGYVLVCVAGAALYLSGQTTFGVIVAFMIYVKLYTSALSQISSSVVTMQSVAASAERVFTFLDYEEMEPDSESRDVSSVKGKVEFRNVCFGYREGAEVIHDFSLSVNPGQKVAIVGPTGSGKTTLVNLLLRFYEIDSGEILIDDTPVSKMSRADIRSLFGMVLQDTWLFEGTLRENIAFNTEGVSDARLDEVCTAVGLRHYMDSLPNGYDTPMDDDNAISVGQKQQVTIARAMLKDPRMVILDEATSSVDPLTERVIQDAMDSIMAGRTSFVIAHRLSTIVNADLIVAMKDGTIAEMGTHEELMSKGGYYRQLYESQFSNPE